MSGLLMFLFYSVNPFYTAKFKAGDCISTEYESRLDLEPNYIVYIKIIKAGKNSYEYIYYWPDHPNWIDKNPNISNSIYKDADYHKIDCPK